MMELRTCCKSQVTNPRALSPTRCIKCGSHLVVRDRRWVEYTPKEGEMLIKSEAGFAIGYGVGYNTAITDVVQWMRKQKFPGPANDIEHIFGGNDGAKTASGGGIAGAP